MRLAAEEFVRFLLDLPVVAASRVIVTHYDSPGKNVVARQLCPLSRQDAPLVRLAPCSPELNAIKPPLRDLNHNDMPE